ncbi:MAG: hypothetical protein ACOYNS_02240, partial [Bacteroidota bacterium]
MKNSIVSHLRWLLLFPFLCASAQTTSTVSVESFSVPANTKTFNVTLSKNFIINSTIRAAIKGRFVK